jgi:hypothetical protein
MLPLQVHRVAGDDRTGDQQILWKYANSCFGHNTP